MGRLTSGPIELLARPPTPPKESTSKNGNSNEVPPSSVKTNCSLLDTPDESPSSSAEYSRSSSERPQKRVGFSPWTDFHRPPIVGMKDSDSDTSIRMLPPSKECKSLKSILKAYNINATDQGNNEQSAFDPTDLLAMLRATAQNLASASRQSRIDSYSTLLACLSAYDDVPEMNGLSERVEEVCGYIRRDVGAKLDLDGSLDIQIVTQALKVLIFFLCTPTMASSLSDGFCTSILDRSISILEDTSSPKILVSHYMHLLEKQKFTSKQMTTDRVNRLLSALSLVTPRIKSNRVTCHRLMIYQRLLGQAKSVMASRVGSWIDHLISGLSNTIKDVRVRAIGFGLDASIQLGQMSSVTQACIEVFNRTSQGGQKMIEFLSSRLIEMVSSKEDGVHVPQIWSIVILFLRSRKRQLECWEHIKGWLIIIQRCLNSSEPQVKFQANIAWSRLIFAINLDTSTSNSMAKMLRQPLISQLERKAIDKTSKQAKHIARSTYCTLLYYAFRPTAKHAQLDQYWDLYVSQVLPKSLKANKSDVNYVCSVLAALCSSDGTPRIWDENRANVNGPIKTEELPCLDPKWMRSKALDFIQIFEKLFDQAVWHSDKDQKEPVRLAWQRFMTALAVASSKEVKVSMDTIKVVTHIINLLKKSLESANSASRQQSFQQHTSEQGKQHDPYDRFKCLLEEVVAKIGIIPFMERRVILTSRDSFEAAGTPSGRPIKDPGSLDSPVMHLLKMLITKEFDQQMTTSYAEAVKAVMHISLQSSLTRKIRLCALRKHAQLLSPDTMVSEQASLVFWQCLADAICASFKLPRHHDLYNASPEYPGPDYREAVKLLEIGIRRRSMTIIPAWREMHDCVVRSLKEEIGDDGVTLIMTLPLADIVQGPTSLCDDALLITAATLMKTTHWPHSHQSIEKAHKLLWGTVGVSHKEKSVDIDKLYVMINALLTGVYGRLANLLMDSVITFVSTLTALLGSCPPVHIANLLTRIQQGLVPWIEDVDGCLGSFVSSRAVRLTSEVDKLWAAVVAAIERFSDHDTRVLFTLQNLLLSGFQSTHRAIINKTIFLWNSTFGRAQALEYPPNLRKELIKLRSFTDILLPTLREDEMGQDTSSPVRFLDSQDDEAEMQQLPLPGPPGRNVTGNHLSHNVTALKAPTLSPTPMAVSIPPLSAPREKKVTPKARLRYDDSQIQFAAIDSSPLATELGNSQTLTDRQKEVRERQGAEVAMFPEIRSSPKSTPSHTEYNLPKLILKSNPVQASRSVVDEEISPMYPPDALMNGFLGSSPTPASSKKGANDTRSDDGPPSSPPYTASRFDTREQRPFSSATNEPNEVLAEEHDDPPENVDDKNFPCNNDRMDTDAECNAVDEATHKLDHEKEITAPVRQLDDRIMSDNDIFVDAPTEPLQNVLGQPQIDDISTVLNSFQGENPPSLSSEDDQVTAQLVGEMERASSQQSGKQYEGITTTSQLMRKRKGSSSHPAHTPRKARRISPSPSYQQGLETPKAGESVAECVLIEVRPSGDEDAASQQRIKNERSPSPSFDMNTPIENHASARRRRRSRSSGKAQASQLSLGNRSVRKHPRQRKTKPESAIIDASMSDSTQKRARKSARLSGLLTSSPQQHSNSPLENVIREPDSITKRGRTKASKRWFWITEESQEEEILPGTGARLSSYDIQGAKTVASQKRPTVAQGPRQLAGEQDPEGRIAGDQEDEDKTPTASGTNEATHHGTPEVTISGGQPTVAGILRGFRRLVDDVKRIAIGREEEREMVGLLFESVKEVHEAGRRQSELQHEGV